MQKSRQKKNSENESKEKRYIEKPLVYSKNNNYDNQNGKCCEGGYQTHWWTGRKRKIERKGEIIQESMILFLAIREREMERYNKKARER